MIKSNYSELDPYKLPLRSNNLLSVNLDFNEGFYKNQDLENDLVTAIKNTKYINYLDNNYEEVLRNLAYFHSVNKDNILIFNGSDAAIDSILRCYLTPSSRIVYPILEYSNFSVFIKICAVNPHNIVRINNHSFLSELTDILESREVDFVYFSNPNNPTGLELESETIIKLVSANPETLFVIDEAYVHFSRESQLEQDLFLKLTVHYNNLVILRTLSKAFSMAGLRAGYIISHNSVIHELKKIHNFKNITFFNTISIRRQILDYSKYMDYVQIIKQNRLLIESFFLEHGNVFRLTNTSSASFVLFKVLLFEQLFLEILEKYNIKIRKFSDSSSLFRITVPFDVGKVIFAFSEFVGVGMYEVDL